MTITFHCEYCGKKIDAVDTAGGKWGKCPSCHNKLYVPAAETGEELKLSPLDENDQEKQRQLMAETYKVEHDILLEREPDPDASVSDKELTKNIILYLRLMLNGELDDAKVIMNSITPYGRQAVNILDRIAVSEMPEPELADIPKQVLAGLIRDLRAKIN